MIEEKGEYGGNVPNQYEEKNESTAEKDQVAASFCSLFSSGSKTECIQLFHQEVRGEKWQLVKQRIKKTEEISSKETYLDLSQENVSYLISFFCEQEYTFLFFLSLAKTVGLKKIIPMYKYDFVLEGNEKVIKSAEWLDFVKECNFKLFEAIFSDRLIKKFQENDFKQWFEQRKDSYNPDWLVIPYGDKGINTFFFSSNEIHTLVDSFHFSPIQQRIVYSFLIDSYEIKENDSDLQTRLSWVKRFYPSEEISEKVADSIMKLFFKRPSFLHALEQNFSEKQLSSFIKDENQLKSIIELSGSWDRVSVKGPEFFSTLEKREFVPILADEEILDRRLEETKHLVQTTGLEPLLKRLVHSICLKKKQDILGRGFFTGSADVWIVSGLNPDKDILTTLLHEVGHAFESFLRADLKNFEWLDRYLVLISCEKSDLSAYAEAHRFFSMENPKEYKTYLSEAFAEEFMISLFAPGLLGIQKKIFFEEMVKTIFSDINFADIRNRIRGAIRRMYHKNPDDLFINTQSDKVRFFLRCLESGD
jgi:hypothetical protein